MSSGAQQIRRAVVAGLKGENTGAGERVFGNRTRPIWKDTMPVVLVFTKEEKAELFQVSPKVYLRTLSLAIAVVDQDQGDPDDIIDDRLDALGEAVERFVFRDPLFGLDRLSVDSDGFEMQDTRYESTDLIQFEPPEGREPETPLAGQRIVFSVKYLTSANEGRTEDLEPFHGGDITWKIKPGDELQDAGDHVVLEGS